VGTVSGGTATNVVAERCTITAEARSRDERALAAQLAAMLDALTWAASESEVDLETRVEREFTGYNLTEREPQVALAVAALSAAGVEPALVATGGGSDVNALLVNGFPSVNLCNGLVAIHTAEERIALADLERMVDVGLALVRAARDASCPRWPARPPDERPRAADPLGARLRRRDRPPPRLGLPAAERRGRPSRGHRPPRRRRHGARRGRARPPGPPAARGGRGVSPGAPRREARSSGRGAPRRRQAGAGRGDRPCRPRLGRPRGVLPRPGHPPRVHLLLHGHRAHARALRGRAGRGDRGGGVAARPPGRAHPAGPRRQDADRAASSRARAGGVTAGQRAR